MSKYVIVTDSTTDLPASFAEELGLMVLPLRFNLNGKEYTNYLDNRELDPKVFYDAVRGGAQPTTSQINPEDYISVLTPVLKEGKDILILAFSSGLSGTFNSARIAVDELASEFKERKILLVDTKSASLGEGLLVTLAAREAKAGKSIEEVKAYAESLVPRLAHWFTVDDIGHLVRGGRLSKVAGFVAKLASIKPVLHCNTEGKLAARHKAIGRKRAIKALVEEMVKTAKPGKQIVYIGHSDDLEGAEALAAEVKLHFEIEELVINMIGPVIGSHAGQGTLALFFVAENR
ncbi:DegV family protein [Acholeplasma hippikon]|uniref:DegV-like protein n=1 Tax=Acholeplasma hippikon TaxID=264636 RepID=A0A449BLI3_9MOLU|nr:DegV family protein [Acholeplasma hippikon]VEU83297.1 degV-like protein [Acholeplasma hippikon]